VFNTEQMNQAVFAFRRYEDASLRYTGIESHVGLTTMGCMTPWLRRTDAEVASAGNFHSCRSASIGSMRAARRAGK
jgi:hypothetical protein